MKNTATEETAAAGQNSETWEVRTNGILYEVHSAREKICDVELNIDDSDDYHERAAANGILIASAPGMLAALEKAAIELGCYVASGGPKSTVDAYQSARAAIAKAKGAQS